jgi:hypothetical protein
MINEGITELVYWKDPITGADVPGSTKGAIRVDIAAGAEIPEAHVTEERKAFLARTGHTGDAFKPKDPSPEEVQAEVAAAAAREAARVLAAKKA